MDDVGGQRRDDLFRSEEKLVVTPRARQSRPDRDHLHASVDNLAVVIIGAEDHRVVARDHLLRSEFDHAALNGATFCLQNGKSRRSDVTDSHVRATSRTRGRAGGRANALRVLSASGARPRYGRRMASTATGPPK